MTTLPLWWLSTAVKIFKIKVVEKNYPNIGAKPLTLRPKGGFLYSPISDYEIQMGLKENPHFSFRWLAEWSKWEKERLKVLEKRAKF